MGYFKCSNADVAKLVLVYIGRPVLYKSLAVVANTIGFLGCFEVILAALSPAPCRYEGVLFLLLEFDILNLTDLV